MSHYLSTVKGKIILATYIIKKANSLVKWRGYPKKYMDLKNILNLGFE